MPSPQDPAPPATPRKIVAGMMALSSALLLLVFVVEDFGDLATFVQAEVPWGLVLRYLVAMAISEKVPTTSPKAMTLAIP